LSLLARLLGFENPAPQPQLPAFDPPVQGAEGGGATGWFEIAQALLFFAIVMGGIFYVVRNYLRDRPELAEALFALRPIQLLRRGWTALWQWLRSWAIRAQQTVGEHLSRRISRRFSPDGLSKLPSRFFRIEALSTRERVLYYYMSILRRADRQGYPRQGHQTPQEYSVTLKPNLPEAEIELESLTEAFVEARYSQHEVKPEQGQRARASWERVRAALRGLKRRRE
jgi:hypothetical protein